MIEIHQSGEGSQNTLLLTFQEAGKTLRVSPGMVRKLVRAGRLKVTHIGRCARISQEEVLRLCNGGQILGGGQ